MNAQVENKMVDRPIVLNDARLKSARVGKRTHLCMPAWHSAGRRLSVLNPESMAHPPDGAMRLPTPWQSLQPGDRLWVQEDFCNLLDARAMHKAEFFYRADLLGGRPMIPGRGVKGDRYRVNNYEAKRMPREGSRYTLAITGVRVFACQDITWEELKAEGGLQYPSDSKNQVWDRAYGIQFPYRLNMDVVGITFKFLAENLEGVPAPPHERAYPVNAALAELLASPVKRPDRGDDAEPLNALDPSNNAGG